MAAKPVIFTILLILLCVTVPTLAATDPKKLKDKAPLVATVIGKPLKDDACNYCGDGYCCNPSFSICCPGSYCCRNDLHCCGTNSCC